MSTKLTIDQSINWLKLNRNKEIKKSHLQVLCSSKRMASEIIGKMRFIEEHDLSVFDFKNPGRPKNKKSNGIKFEVIHEIES